MSRYLPSNETACFQSSKVCFAVQDSTTTPEESKWRQGTQRRYVHRWADWGIRRVRRQDRCERAGMLDARSCTIAMLTFYKDRALRGFKGDCVVFAPCGDTLLQSALVGHNHARSSCSTRFTILFSICGVGMGRRDVAVQASRPKYSTWHVQLYDLLIPRLGGLERS